MVFSIDAAMASAAQSLMLGVAVVLLVLLRAAASDGSVVTFPGDAAALASLRAAVDSASVPTHSCLASWDSARDPCRDFMCGLRCFVPANSSYHRVYLVSLETGAGYSGTLPATVFTSLPFLEFLSISDNRFHGALPAGTPLQPSLRFLYLSRNAFSGEIPGSLFTPESSLEVIELYSNAFSGRIPPQVASLGALRRLELENNSLTGNLPPMGKMRSLLFLDVTGNAMSGSPRDLLGQLPRSILSFVAVNNSFAGPLPGESLVALPELCTLDLTSNAVTGAVPAAAFVHPTLKELTLTDNQLDSVEASHGGASSQLDELNLGGNRLSGRLPGFIAAMPSLRLVRLDRNRFTGGIPNQYAARVAAEGGKGKWLPFLRLMLQENYLCGALPSQFRQLKEDDDVEVSLAGNCFLRCPRKFFFCQGAPQKSNATCPKCFP